MSTRPRRDDDASPMSSYRCLSRPSYLYDFSSLAQVKIQFQTKKKKHTSQTKYKSKFNFELKKKLKSLCYHVVVLVKTFPLMKQSPVVYRKRVSSTFSHIFTHFHTFFHIFHIFTHFSTFFHIFTHFSIPITTFPKQLL